MYDIVAWILSVCGPVPSTPVATRDNYYYPLMMIGYVFCDKLIPQRPKSKVGSPDVWSVMWFKQTVDNRIVTRVVVGATLDSPRTEIKDNAKDFRKALLDASHILNWDPDAPSIIQERDETGQDFGHCAETYPLLFICS